MSTIFPTAEGRVRGYNREQVDVFLAAARDAYDIDDTETPTMTSADIRRTSFNLARGGYATHAVDAALERLEDAFALRERERALAEKGKGEWLTAARETAQVILNRLNRDEGHRFSRTNVLAQGYNVDDVDALSDRLKDYFEKGTPVSADTVRTAVFRAQRGGYVESQVDLVLDAVTEVMLAVR
ncbi:MAG: DivIVA domain-containing protein [Mycetocola sp.]